MNTAFYYPIWRHMFRIQFISIEWKTCELQNITTKYEIIQSSYHHYNIYFLLYEFFYFLQNGNKCIIRVVQILWASKSTSINNINKLLPIVCCTIGWRFDFEIAEMWLLHKCLKPCEPSNNSEWVFVKTFTIPIPVTVIFHMAKAHSTICTIVTNTHLLCNLNQPCIHKIIFSFIYRSISIQTPKNTFNIILYSLTLSLSLFFIFNFILVVLFDALHCHFSYCVFPPPPTNTRSWL